MCSFDEWYEGREWCRNWKSDAQTAWDAALDAAAKVLQKQVDAEEFGGELTDKGCIIEECIDAIERLKEEG
jgi:hypothetical protein